MLSRKVVWWSVSKSKARGREEVEEVKAVSAARGRLVTGTLGGRRRTYPL
jgi:hypothetical protein